MTDGESRFPFNASNNLKTHLSTQTFKDFNIKFEFNAIGFRCNSPVLNNLVRELGGTSHFADSGAQLTKIFMEILNKKTD